MFLLLYLPQNSLYYIAVLLANAVVLAFIIKTTLQDINSRGKRISQFGQILKVGLNYFLVTSFVIRVDVHWPNILQILFRVQGSAADNAEVRVLVA